VATLAYAHSTKADPPLTISAEFELETADAGDTAKLTGALSFIPGGSVCVQVKTPRRQEMLLSIRELVIYYPEQDLALTAHISARQAPPMLDAIAAGLVDPASTLPARSKLLEQKRVGPNLLTRWRTVDDKGETLGEMRSVESRDGVLSIELVSPDGKPQRRFSFADRLRVGARSVPRQIVAEYFARDGARRRQERWGLSHVAPLGAGAMSPSACARRGPKTRVQELVW
jgi:hypothetical protein